MKNLFSVTTTLILLSFALSAKGGGTNTPNSNFPTLSYPMGDATSVTNYSVNLVTAINVVIEAVTPSNYIQYGRILTNETFASKADLDTAIQNAGMTLISSLAMSTNASSSQLYQIQADALHGFPNGQAEDVLESTYQFHLVQPHVNNVVSPGISGLTTQLPSQGVIYNAPNASVVYLGSTLVGTTISTSSSSTQNPSWINQASGFIQLPISLVTNPSWSNNLAVVYHVGTTKSYAVYDSQGNQRAENVPTVSSSGDALGNNVTISFNGGEIGRVYTLQQTSDFTGGVGTWVITPNTLFTSPYGGVTTNFLFSNANKNPVLISTNSFAKFVVYRAAAPATLLP